MKHTLERAAEAYEALLVPALFDPWARRMTDTLDLEGHESVLDVACGTGALARRLHARLGTDGSVTAVDINPGMLAVARRLEPGVAWREGDAAALPFEDAAFDVVVSQFGLMLFDDADAALREMHRVLRPGGRLRLLVFDGLAHNEAYAAVADVYERVVGADVAGMLRAPFRMGDADDLAARCRAAGFGDAHVETVEETARFESPRHVVRADVEGWFPLAGIALEPAVLERVVEETARELDSCTAASGAVAFPTAAHLVAAEKAGG